MASDETVVGLFAIKLDEISSDELRLMRRLLSRFEYRRAMGLKKALDAQTDLRNAQIEQMNERLRKENRLLRGILLERQRAAALGRR